MLTEVYSKMKKILALSLAALLALSAVGCGKKDTTQLGDDDKLEVEADVRVFENFEYAVNDSGNYEIVGYTKEATSIEVISSIEGRPVTGIATDAFKSVSTLKSITLPSTITYIGDFAFYGCTGLETVAFTDEITEIGNGAFWGCSALTNITLPTSLKSIGSNAFLECTKLNNMTFPATLEEIGFGAFWKCESITEVTIPARVTSVDAGAFWGCENLTKLTVNTEDVKVLDEKGNPVLDDEDKETFYDKDFNEDAFPSELEITVTAKGTKAEAALLAAGYTLVYPSAE